MRYLIQPKDSICVKGYGFLSFAKNMGKNLSSKYGQKLDNPKKSTIDAIKTASKRAVQKTAEATGDLTGITSVSKKSSTRSRNSEANDELETPRERYISPEKKITNY